MSELAYMLSLMGPHSRAHTLRILERFPDLHLTSTLRTPERNRAVGGSPKSYHLKGRAADFAGRTATLQQARRFARSSRVGPRCYGPEEVLIHDSGTGLHLHVAW